MTTLHENGFPRGRELTIGWICAGLLSSWHRHASVSSYRDAIRLTIFSKLMVEYAKTAIECRHSR